MLNQKVTFSKPFILFYLFPNTWLLEGPEAILTTWTAEPSVKDPLVRLPFPVECPPSRCTVYKIGVNDLQVVIVIFYITPAIKMRFSQIVNYCNYKSVNLSPISLIGLTSKFTFI